MSAVVLLLNACHEKATVDSPLIFNVANPAPAAEAYEREYVGEIQAVQHVELRSRLRGFVESIGVDEGRSVKKGQLLFTVSARELQQELLKARAATQSAAAELSAAEIELANTKVLFDKKVISDAEMSVGNSKIKSARAKLEEAKAHEGGAEINVSYALVRAPFDGTVNRIPKKAGSVVEDGDLLTTLSNTNEVFVYFRLSEQEFLDYSASSEEQRTKEVNLKLANGSLYPASGHIDAVESEFSKETGNIAFRARFPNDKQLLKHGGTGKVVVSTRVQHGLVVPQKSTFEVQEHVYIYLVDKENVVRARRIEPKLRLKDSFIVDAGLTADDRFVLEGLQKLKDGDRISARSTATLPHSSL